MPTLVADLAPTLVAGGVPQQEVKDSILSPPIPVPPKPAPIQPKHFREAMRLLVAHPELTDREVAVRATSIPVDVVAKLRLEVAAIKANPEAVVAEAVVEPEPKPGPIGEGPFVGGEEPKVP